MAPLHQHIFRFNMAPSTLSMTTWHCKTASSLSPSRQKTSPPLHRFNKDITVLPALRKSAFERQIPALQKTPGKIALPRFHKIVYANFCRNQDHSLNVRHTSVLVFNASVSNKESAQPAIFCFMLCQIIYSQDLLLCIFDWNASIAKDSTNL